MVHEQSIITAEYRIGRRTSGFKELIPWIAPWISPAWILFRISIRAVILSRPSLDRARFASRANDMAADGYPW